MKDITTDVKKTSFDHWTERTTCHGIFDWQEAPNKCSKIFWTIILVGCFGMLIFQLRETLSSFADGQQQWITTVYHDHQDEMEFPIVTVCNINRVRQSMVERYGMDDNLLTTYFAGFTSDYPVSQLASINGTTKTPATAEFELDMINVSLTRFVKWKEKNGLNNRAILENFGHRCQDMFLRVWSYGKSASNGHKFCHGQNDTPVSAKSIIHPEFGLCHQLNVSKLIKGVSMPGALQGLNIALNSEMDEHLPLIRMNYIQQGFAVILNFDGAPTVGNYIYVDTGRHTYVSMRQSRTTTGKQFLLFKPPCLTKDNEQQLRYYTDQHYSKHMCELECLMDMENETCGRDCLPFVDNPRYRICETEEIIRCRTTLIATITESKYNSNFPKCHRQCWENCETKMIHTTMSSARFPGRHQAKRLKEEMFKHLVRWYPADRSDPNGMAVVSIYYSSMAVEVMERYLRISLDQLISRIGGQMGIWAGMSVLTLVQAVTFCVANCHAKIRARVRPIAQSPVKNVIYVK